MKDVVIEIRKGMVSGIFSDQADARFVVVDWDLEERVDGPVAGVEECAPLAALPVMTKFEYERAV
jgi:hypothetical protein